MRSNLCAFLAVLLFFSASVSAATLTPLGDLPGGIVYSDARGVSGDGSVVVGTSNPTSDYESGFQAFRWTSGSGMVGLSGPAPPQRLVCALGRCPFILRQTE